ncbi:hypothetical protein JCM16303_006935 [Sporobolomyces ruberrimus]
MSRHEATPPRLTLDISTPSLRSSSFFSVSHHLPELIPPPRVSKPPTSRNDLFDQDWTPVTPNLRSRSSTAESRFSIESGTPSPASTGRRSWMDMRDDVVIVNEHTPIPGQHSPEFNWPSSPPSPNQFLAKKPGFQTRSPAPPPILPIVTFPPTPTSPSQSTFSPRPPLSPSSSSWSVLPPNAGHSDNPLLDTRQAPTLRFSPTSNYLLGEGRHASVYLASFSPRSPSPARQGPSLPPTRQLCAAKRLFPDRESQLSGLGEAFILSKLTTPVRSTSTSTSSPPTLDRRNSSDSLAERGSHHILKLYGVKDESDGLDAPLSTLERSESRRSLKRLSAGSTFAGSPLRGTTNDSPSSPDSPTTPPAPSTANKVLPPRQSPKENKVVPSSSPTRPPHSPRKSLLPSLAPPLSSSSAQRYKSQHQAQTPNSPSTLAPSPLPSSITTLPPPTITVEPRIDLILEFCPFGNLLQFARNQPERMNRKRFFQWAIELTAAVALCHDRGVLHADIKPQNIMISTDLTTRLCDFGMSLFLPPASSPRSAFPSDPHGLGTPTYSPPEFVRPLPSTFSYPSDIFSLGVTLGVMISGREPFEGVRAVERMVLVGNGGWWEWEERKRLKDLDGDQLEVDEGSSLYNLSLGGDDRLSRQGSLRSLRSEKDGLRRSITRTSLRRSGSSDSLRSIASLGAGRDWETIIQSLLVEEEDVATNTTSQLANFALPPLPTSAASSPTHSRNNSLTNSADSFTSMRAYPGTSTPVQTFLDGVSIVPLEIRDLLRRMASPYELDRPSAKDVLSRLDELAKKYE